MTLRKRVARLESAADGEFDIGRFFHDLLRKPGEEAVFESRAIIIGDAKATEAALSRWFRSLGLEVHHERE